MPVNPRDTPTVRHASGTTKGRPSPRGTGARTALSLAQNPGRERGLVFDAGDNGCASKRSEAMRQRRPFPHIHEAAEHERLLHRRGIHRPHGIPREPLPPPRGRKPTIGSFIAAVVHPPVDIPDVPRSGFPRLIVRLACFHAPYTERRTPMMPPSPCLLACEPGAARDRMMMLMRRREKRERDQYLDGKDST